MIRKILFAAMVAAPMMLVPAHVDAQQRGAAQAARGQAAAEAGKANQERAQQAAQEAPEGLRKAFEGRTPPPALQRRFPDLAPQPAPAPAVEPAPEPAPEPEPEETCETSMAIVDGQIVEVDCHGNLVGME